MNQFFHLYFKGGRYDEQHGIPLSALPGLAKIERLVRAVARDLFFDGNEDRKRVSPGFDDAFAPAITSIVGGGSADCDVSWSPPVRDANAAHFESARTEIVELLEAFRKEPPTVPPWLSRESTQLLADVLESIDDGESVRWDAAEGEEVTVGVDVRERVRAEATRPRPAKEEPFQIVGRIHRIADDPWAAGVHVWETKRSVTVPLQQGLKGKITNAWERNETTLVRLTGIANRDADGYRRFIEATSIDIIAGPQLTKRIEELASVKNGWLGDEEPATVPTRRFLVLVERSLWGLIERTGVDRPYLFLQPDASVEAVWKPPGKTVSVRFTGGESPLVSGRAVRRTERTLVRSEPYASLDKLEDWLTAQLGSET